MSNRPLTDSLRDLQKSLEDSFTKAAVTHPEWSHPKPLRQLIKKVEARHDVEGIQPDPLMVSEAIAFFRKHLKPDGWRGLKYACLGAGLIDDKSRSSLLSVETTRNALLQIASDNESSRRNLRCFQYLLRAYWSYPIDDPSAENVQGFETLRDWLSKQFKVLNKKEDIPKSKWFPTIESHSNLLTKTPCAKYASEMLSGDLAKFNGVVEALSIPSNSWLMVEAIIAQLEHASGWSDDNFKKSLVNLIKLAMGEGGLRTSKGIQQNAMGILLSRYARCKERPESIALRDAALSLFGHPGVKRLEWETHVVFNNRPDEDARQMVWSWLKQRLIRDFFENGSGDERRRAYWLRFEPLIDDMWFALGAESRRRRDEVFVEIRNRAEGRLLNLDQTVAGNDAFMMRIGGYLAIEFGSPGHAFYLHDWSRLPKSLIDKLNHHVPQDVSIASLRSVNPAYKGIHRDSTGAFESWEQKFDFAMAGLIGRKPEQRAAFLPQLEDLLIKYRVSDAEDRRRLDGFFWVNANNSVAAFNREMQEMGFHYTTGSGWRRR